MVCSDGFLGTQGCVPVYRQLSASNFQSLPDNRHFLVFLFWLVTEGEETQHVAIGLDDASE